MSEKRLQIDLPSDKRVEQALKLMELVEEQITKKMENYEHGYYLTELQSLLEKSMTLEVK